MAEGDQKKSSRQAIAHLQQRVKDLLLAKKLPKKAVDEILESLGEIVKIVTEAEGYRRRNSDDLAENREAVARKKLDEAEKDIDEKVRQQEEEPTEEEEEETEEPQERQRKKDQKKKVEEAEKIRKQIQQKSKGKAPVKVGGGGAAGGGVAGGGAAAGGAAAGGGSVGLIVAIIAILLIIVIALFMYFGGVAHKAFNEGGGSFPISMDYDNPEHQVLAGEVMRLKNAGVLVFKDRLEKDIEWVDVEGKMTMNLDWRIMVTLRYLGEKWERRSEGVLGINLSTSNGPDTTRRGVAVKIAGIALADQREEPLDAPSAYATGQAIGISQIGRMSLELAKACPVTEADKNNILIDNTPIEVSWQEIASQQLIRPTYEQLQVDSKTVYEGGAVLNGIAKQAKENLVYRNQLESSITNPETWFVKVGDALDLMISNLTSMSSADSGVGIDTRTVAYARSALEKLMAVRETTRGKVVEWDDDALMQNLRDGLQMTFRMMQVANVVGWQGDKKSKCRLWKAYEARQNIRQLVLDLEQMPADPLLVASQTDWNPELMVRQLIVFSPEDDLDNGLPNLDVFPHGAVAVDEGGVGFDDTDKDNTIDEKDSHFMDLPIDNGVFSKMNTIFIYKDEDKWQKAGDVLTDIALAAGTLGGSLVVDALNDLATGTGISVLSGERTEKVSYKNFVHIGF